MSTPNHISELMASENDRMERYSHMVARHGMDGIDIAGSGKHKLFGIVESVNMAGLMLLLESRMLLSFQLRLEAL